MSDPFEVAHLVDRFMRRIEARLHVRAVRIDTERVGPFGGMVLLTLEELQPAPIQKLVTQMARDKSQMTRIVKSLEDKGLIERRDCPGDGRVALLNLTRKGDAFVGELKTLLSSVIGEILAPLPGEDCEALINALRKI